MRKMYITHAVTLHLVLEEKKPIVGVVGLLFDNQIGESLVTVFYANGKDRIACD